ncbi:T9SS type A sorting domain-containing protein [Flavobacterium cheniae]|uniref:Putative secreted protein (Por secretion system target) n=1 Tax=Flavobacterium cheniae TaxID=295428 RepID=A0A562KMF4_9FLAO|nr:T9SS type A sorting domain-containing protein [Flavobacterium cheniae]TDR24294.1 putative secreted protein (Por secretion system target) [Flavobacterium cheniae]TWH96413.1 putative secreted protein (Por secretion system target) [Flavobacterium cheniae]
MKKLYTLLLLSISLLSFSQGSVNFDDVAKWTQGGGGTIAFTTFSDHSYVDASLNFTAVGNSVIRNSTAAQDGFPLANGTYSFRLNQTGTSALTMTIASGGVGNFSFATRRWDSAPATNFTVEYSTNNGTSWTTSSIIDASVTTDSNWKTVSGVINSTNANIQIRVRSNGTTERLMIDDFTWTAPTSNPTLVISSPTNGTLYNPATTSVNINFATSNFVIATVGNGNGHLNYTINGGAVQSKFDNTAIALTSLTPGTYNLALELVNDSNASLSPAVTATVSFTIQSYTNAANLNDVRLDVLNDGIGKYYNITGEAIVTYARATRNQKYIQDATAAILIDDLAGVITNPFVIGDGITGLKGQTTYFNGVLQIVPLENNTPSSNGNVITPQVVTASAINASIEQYESELVRINNVTFADGNGTNTFAANTSYNISDGNTIEFRTFLTEVDYVVNTNVIPNVTRDVIVLVAKNVTTPRIVARSFVDVNTLSTNDFDAIEGLKMYPNPLKGNTLYLTSTANAEMSVQIFDIVGKEVIKSNVMNNTVNVSGLNAGIYIVKVTEEGKTATRKLVIQ